ncbi:MAG: 2-amino-4-hydroxy-6-hydroxymethyldihydropteridine diphosphokinase [Halioglobus sp.]|nr:2-amino-4-hydroxy-6-hydroxymethyldihydropteridine diphosphokinase [Halioglobus sp.]
MAVVYLGVGSNIERERYICAGLDALERLFGAMAMSSVYDGAAVGFAGQPFLNLVVRIETDMALEQLAATLRHLEREHGRPDNAPRLSARQLDIDILTYDDRVGTYGHVTLPREEILYNAFVLRPLAELAPQVQHPVARRSYAELWRDYDHAAQTLRRVDFDWRGRSISAAE